MSYQFANNNYSSYEQSITNILNRNKLDFLGNNNVGIFDVNTEFGLKYCNQIFLDFPEIAKEIKIGKYKYEIEKFREVGEQDVFFSNELDIYINANTARYIYHALIISKYIKEKYSNTAIDIVEIGGGYGGLCYWLRVFLKSVINYTIIDLPTPCKLQDRCLTYLKTQCTSISDIELFRTSSRPLFFISNYGYSEFNQYYQDLYKNKIISQANGGFLIWNNWTGIYKFTDYPLKIEDERPYFENIYNKFIYF